MRDDEYCRRTLSRVSRTFALAIRVLPAGLKRSVLPAYLLCRIADTLEDDTSLPAAERAAALERYAEVSGGFLRGERTAQDAGELQAALDELGRRSALGGEDAAASWSLAGNVTAVLNSTAGLPGTDRAFMAECVTEMARGMAGFVRRESDGVDSGGRLPPLVGRLRDETDLVRYADCVAGNVGRFLQRSFCHSLGLEGGATRETLERTAFHFSLGLQFTNIIQDIVADRRRGWCYVPETLLGFHGLTAENWLDPGQREQALEVVKDLIRKALDHLEGALEFTLTIPRRAPRVRLFCLWPLFLALATLTRAWGNPAVLDEKVKVERREVRRLVRATSLRCLWSGALRRLYVKEADWLQARV
ncbi:MAG: hypothetical protein GF355_06175 [Candidatus Eisenbacteria bacterium]|nr:hypothetical protein [Candidatus Eisenbacteria bacterium]